MRPSAHDMARDDIRHTAHAHACIISKPIRAGTRAASSKATYCGRPDCNAAATEGERATPAVAGLTRSGLWGPAWRPRGARSQHGLQVNLRSRQIQRSAVAVDGINQTLEQGLESEQKPCACHRGKPHAGRTGIVELVHCRLSLLLPGLVQALFLVRFIVRRELVATTGAVVALRRAKDKRL